MHIVFRICNHSDPHLTHSCSLRHYNIAPHGIHHCSQYRMVSTWSHRTAAARLVCMTIHPRLQMLCAIHRLLHSDNTYCDDDTTYLYILENLTIAPRHGVLPDFLQINPAHSAQGECKIVSDFVDVLIYRSSTQC
jgi:hypothetical protein